MTAITDYLRSIGKKGGEARSLSLTSERRSAIAKKAAKARWKAQKKKAK